MLKITKDRNILRHIAKPFNIMKNTQTIVFLAFFTTFAMLSSPILFNGNEKVLVQQDKPKIVCYFSITEDWTKNIVGDLCDVETLVSGPQDIHSYDPSAEAVLKMDGADLYVMLGIPIEAYAQQIANAFPNVPTLTLRVPTLEDPENGADPIEDPVWILPDGSHPKNGHFWTSPHYAIKFVNRLRDGIKEEIGVSQPSSFNQEIDQNYNSYKSQLETSLENLNLIASQKPFLNMKVCPFHPAFIYFFEDLGIERVAVIEQQPGGTISPEHLDEVYKLINSSVIVLYHPQEAEGKANAETVAIDNGAMLTWLTPLLPVNTPENLKSQFGEQIDTYLEMIEFNVYQLENPTFPQREAISGYHFFLLIISFLGISLIIGRDVRKRIK